MADDQGKCSSLEIGECSDSTMEINVKTLDSRIYTFRVNKNMPIPSLKAKVANASGVPVEQQRLIFRGKVLRDDHLLSDYHLEDGHTLHLVVREPAQAQTPTGTAGGGSSRITDNQGNDRSNNAPHNRVGQVSHGVVLGTVNISDQGEGMVADIGRVVGSVLQSIGAGILSTPPGANNVSSAAAPSSGETERLRNVSGRTQLGDQERSAVTSVNQSYQVIPDSLMTLLDFINRMELILQRSGETLQSTAPSNVQNPPGLDNASLNVNRLPTADVLSSVIERARVLLSGNAAAAFAESSFLLCVYSDIPLTESDTEGMIEVEKHIEDNLGSKPRENHLAERLTREATSADPVIRSHIQSEAVHMGLVMQHLGSMLLELGRTTMMLRMGPSPDGSFVNAGPAVYISSSGPNPMMVQPSSPQLSSLLAASSPQLSSLLAASSPLLSGPFTPLNNGDLARNINIHILSGTSMAPAVSSSGARVDLGDANRSGSQNVEQTRQNGGGSGPSGNAPPMRGMAARTVVAAIPARAPGEIASNVLGVVYPVQMRSQLSGPIYTALSQGSLPPLSRGMELSTSDTVQPSTQPGSVSPIVAQANAGTSGALPNNVLDGRSSSFPLLPLGAQGSHSENNESQSIMNVQPPQTTSGSSNVSDVISHINEEIATVTSGSSLSQSSLGVVGQQLIPEGAFSINSTETTLSDRTTNVPDVISRGDGQQEALTAGVTGGLTSCITSSTHSTISAQSSEGKLKSAAASDDSSNNASGSCTPTPLGLGHGGLQPKRRSKSTKPVLKDGMPLNSPSVEQTQESITKGQEFLRSFVSRNSVGNQEMLNSSSTPLPPVLGQLFEGMSLRGQGSREQVDGSDMSNILHSPLFNNILTNVAEQSGLGSPATLRNMMEQCTQNPAMRNTLNNIVQQVESQDLGSILSSSGEGGGIDFSSMIQQMMPMVSQAIGMMSSSSPASGSGRQIQSNNMTNQDENEFQINLHEAQQRIEQCDSPGSIFGAMLEGTRSAHGEESSFIDLVRELGNDTELSSEYSEMLRHHLKQRLIRESKSEEKH